MITIDPKNFKVIVQFKCKLETVRTHHISIIEHEGLQASYTADRTLNTLSGSYKLFSNIISNFKINEEELSIIATERNVLIQNYLVGSFVDSNFVRSHITLKWVQLNEEMLQSRFTTLILISCNDLSPEFIGRKNSRATKSPRIQQ